MPLYNFSLGPEQGMALDATSLPDLESARRHAITKALEILWDCPYRLHATPEWGVVVSDGTGLSLFTVSLFEALRHDARAESTGQAAE